jgi:predicted Zn-dependent protease
MQRALAEFYVLQFDATSEQTPFIERFSWLARALTIDINFPLTYARLAILFQPKRTPDEVEQLKTTFQQILVSGANPAVAHFALGFLASQSPETQRDAVWHLTQAQNLQPPVAFAYSNVARTLAESTPARFAEAELFARQAISGTVQEAPLYLTLGKVLGSQAKWTEAIEVLATAIEKFPDSAPLHQSLAQAYEAVGETTKAASLREIADQIQNSAKPEKNIVPPPEK